MIIIVQAMEPYSWSLLFSNSFQMPKEKIFLEKRAWDWSVYVNIWCVSNPSPPCLSMVNCGLCIAGSYRVALSDTATSLHQSTKRIIAAMKEGS